MNTGCENEFETKLCISRPEIIFCDSCYKRSVLKICQNKIYPRSAGGEAKRTCKYHQAQRISEQVLRDVLKQLKTNVTESAIAEFITKVRKIRRADTGISADSRFGKSTAKHSS